MNRIQARELSVWFQQVRGISLSKALAATDPSISALQTRCGLGAGD